MLEIFLESSCTFTEQTRTSVNNETGHGEGETPAVSGSGHSNWNIQRQTSIPEPESLRPPAPGRWANCPENLKECGFNFQFSNLITLVRGRIAKEKKNFILKHYLFSVSFIF